MPGNSIWRFQLALHHLLSLARAVTCPSELPSGSSLLVPFSHPYRTANPPRSIVHRLACDSQPPLLFRLCPAEIPALDWLIPLEIYEIMVSRIGARKNSHPCNDRYLHISCNNVQARNSPPRVTGYTMPLTGHCAFITFAIGDGRRHSHEQMDGHTMWKTKASYKYVHVVMKLPNPCIEGVLGIPNMVAGRSRSGRCLP